MTAPSALRFFALVVRPPPAILAASLAIAGGGIYWALVDPPQFGQAAALALFFQMFSAATGYRDRLRRGHFDAILTAQRRRLRIAAAHGVVSVAPGMVLWAVLAVIEAALIRQGWPSTLTSSGLAAVAIVSVVAWAIAVVAGRHSAGAIWIAALFVLVSIGRIEQLRYAFLTADMSWLPAARQAAAAILCPFFLLADRGAMTARAFVLLAAAVAAIWLAAAALVARCDGPLEERV